MKVVIIEDEELAAKRLMRMINEYDSSIDIVAMLESVEDSIEWFNENDEPDLIFLDIHLEDGLSFSIFDKVRISAPIIFTTAFDEYAIKAFKLKSIDYLLKPITKDELVAAIAKYKELFNSKSIPDANVDISSLIKMLTKKEPAYKSRFAVTLGTKIKSIDTSEVAYFFSEEGITFMVTESKSSYTIDQSLDQLCEELDPKSFFRVNRQFLVSLKSIQNVHIFPKSRLKLELMPATNKEVYVSIDKVTKFKSWLGN